MLPVVYFALDTFPGLNSEWKKTIISLKFVILVVTIPNHLYIREKKKEKEEVLCCRGNW